MGGTEFILGALELGVGNINGDHGGGTGQTGAGDGGHAHATHADDGDGLATLHLAGVHGRTQSGHHAATQQACHGRVSIRIHLGALTLVDQRLFHERADSQRGFQLGAVLQGHDLGGVVSIEAVLRLALLAGAALAAHRAPVQHHVIADLHVGDILAHGLHDSGGLVAQKEWVVIGDSAVAVGHIGVAHAAGLDLDHYVIGAGIRDDDIGELHWLALGPRDDALHCLSHESLKPPACLCTHGYTRCLTSPPCLHAFPEPLRSPSRMLAYIVRPTVHLKEQQ